MFAKIKPVVAGLSAKEKRTVIFAAKELSRYLGLADSFGDFPVIPVQTKGELAEDSLYLFVGCDCLPKVEDARFDDAIAICTKGLSGVISGTNARSVLIGAYRFLRENGYAFTKPGKMGEVIPDTLAPKDLSIVEAASYRHRGICIEGSVYEEGLIDLIDWMPKVAMNAYFFQFLEPKRFFENYYKRIGAKMSEEEIVAMADQVRDAIWERSLLYHAVGHGWTSAAMGVDSHTDPKFESQLTEEQRSMMALVNGKRAVSGNFLNTNLCFSSDLVKEKFTDVIMEYVETHDNIDYLHVWIADGGQNNCECENCAKAHVSDHYVSILNELDRKLTAKGIDTKIVFLIYSSLVWAPLYERLDNPDRFIMMWAPFLRYFDRVLDPALVEEVPPYEPNRSVALEKAIGRHLSYYHDWRKIFDGDSFDFDYHFCEEHVFEMSGYQLAKVLYQDIRNFKELGMNGLLDCQNQRAFVPTSLGMNVQAYALWNRDMPFDEIAKMTLSAEFGEDYQAVWDYVKALSEQDCSIVLHSLDWLKPEEDLGDIHSPENQEKLACANEIISTFRDKYADKVKTGATEQIRHNWDLLLFFGAFHQARNLYHMVKTKEETIELQEKFRAYADANIHKFKIEMDGVPELGLNQATFANLEIE